MSKIALVNQLRKYQEEERKYKEMFRCLCQNILGNYHMDGTVYMVSSVTGRKYSGKIVLEETGLLPIPYYFCFHSYNRDNYGRVIFMEPWYMSEEDIQDIETFVSKQIIPALTME